MNTETGHKLPLVARLRVGMRIIKTVLAVFICSVISFYRGVSPLQSTMAAIICIQPDKENTMNMAVSRILATLLGSVSATLLLLILSETDMAMPSITFYLIISVLLIPLILVTVKMGWPTAAALTCIIFLSIALGYDEKSSIFMSSLGRMVDTLIGIIVAVIINAIRPNRLAVPASETEDENAKPPGQEQQEPDGDGDNEEHNTGDRPNAG